MRDVEKLRAYGPFLDGLVFEIRSGGQVIAFLSRQRFIEPFQCETRTQQLALDED
jgi:hypothetical protein